MALLDRFQARHIEICNRTLLWRPDFVAATRPGARRLDLAGPASDLLGTAIGQETGHLASWLPGSPLAAQLVTGRRITVDIAPPFLADWRASYNLPEEALIEFGQAGMLLFNIRDFNPLVSEESQRAQAAAYQPWRDFIERLFDAAWNSIYFLASLRPALFDAIPGSGGAQGLPLAENFALANLDLERAARAAALVSAIDVEASRATFRGERGPHVATCWHWAYFEALRRFVDPDFGRFIADEYAALSDASDTLSGAAELDLGRRYLAFQTRMRFAHLVYSAPLSAAFGGVYSYALADEHIFMQAVERQFRWSAETPFEYDYFEDDLLDLMQDIQSGQLRPWFAEYLNGKNWERLRDLGPDVFARTETTGYFEHYSDPTNRRELVSYWTEWSETSRTFLDIGEDIEALIGDEAIDPKRLFDLAGRVREERNASDLLLRRHTEGYQTRSTPTPGMRLTSDKITAADPKRANLLLRALVWLGLRRTNGDIAVGMRGDHNRLAQGVGRNFRDNPR